MIYGNVVLITGASSGIGKSIAQALMEKGYRVYGTSRKPQTGNNRILSKSSGNNAYVEIIQLDVRSEDSVKKAIDYVMKKEGHIDILINNAGYGIAGSVEDTTAEEAFEQFDTNFFGVIRVCRNVIPIMRRNNRENGKNKNGLIINISSVAGIIPIPFQSMYSASKFALESMSEALRIELEPFGIKVVIAEPGDTSTGFTDNRQFVKGANESSIYKEKFFKSVNTMIKDERNGPGPETVARTILKIIDKKNPPVRITVGAGYKLVVFIKRLIPSKLLHYILSKLY
ncbi:MAG TPA: SDR family oxidoreductase [Clostridiales bacterium]|nr:SDR family oxidoreductase [Clostridiales bacterium]